MPAENIPDQDNYLKILGRLDEIAPDQVAALRARMPEKRKKLFDMIPEECKQVLVLLDTISDTEMEMLFRLSENKGILAGLHHLNEHLHSLISLTDDKEKRDRFLHIFNRTRTRVILEGNK